VADAAPAVTIVAVGVMVPEALAAADELTEAGHPADVICLTSPGLVFDALRARSGLSDAAEAVLEDILPGDRAAPMVTVLDGHPHTLAFLGSVRCVPITCLGVDDFGQSGDVGDLYRHFGIDAATIVGAALDLLP
jgi:pyruvate dehydrogenase E1 component